MEGGRGRERERETKHSVCNGKVTDSLDQNSSKTMSKAERGGRGKEREERDYFTH